MLLLGAAATALAAVAVLVAGRDEDTVTLLLAAAWWPLAFLAGLLLGRRPEPGPRLTRVLSTARTAAVLPEVRPAVALLNRLWPLGVFAAAAGGIAWLWPQVAAIAAGYALLWSLAWRRKEAAVTAVEERDGVRFYVEPGPALQPIRLVRTPGFTRES